MEDFMEGKEDAWYEQPSNVVGVLVNPITGKPVTTNDGKQKLMYYIKGTEPTDSDPVFDSMLEEEIAS